MKFYLYFLRNGSKAGIVINDKHLFCPFGPENQDINSRFEITLERNNLSWASVETAVRACYTQIQNVEEGREYTFKVDGGRCEFVSRNTVFANADAAIRNLEIEADNIVSKYSLTNRDSLFR